MKMTSLSYWIFDGVNQQRFFNKNSYAKYNFIINIKKLISFAKFVRNKVMYLSFFQCSP